MPDILIQTHPTAMRSSSTVAWITAWVAVAAIHASPQISVSPAEQRIAWAERAIQANPAEPQGHIDLALALSRRARETGDAAYYSRAEEALAPALRVNQPSFDARKVQVWILLGQREFARARELATTLNKQMPDDVQVYGLLADANVGLGRYGEAEAAVQWMLDLRPTNPYGQTRTAVLRELFGDVDGAIDMLSAALATTAAAEVEDRAWILSQMGRLYASVGKQREADAAAQAALALFPGYHAALGVLAQVRRGQQRYADAATVLKELCAVVPRPENLYALAEALELAKSPDAVAAFADFEKKALAASPSADNANRELVGYYANHGKNAKEALRVAELERARRADVYTLDAYAWALSQNGRHAEAKKQLDAALAVGVQDAEILYHAGVIASKLRDAAAATRYLKQSLERNPQSGAAAASRALLAQLTPASTKPARKSPPPR